MHSVGTEACHVGRGPSHPTRATLCGLGERKNTAWRRQIGSTAYVDGACVASGRGRCVSARRVWAAWLECEGESFVSSMGVA